MEPKYLPKGGQWHLEASKATSNEDEENTLRKRDQEGPLYKPVLAWEREARYNGDTVFTTT